MKVGIVGSRRYENSDKVRQAIVDLKKEFGSELIIVSGGQEKGADGLAKKHAIELGVCYVEFPPAHYRWNKYCVNSNLSYNKKYNVGNYFARNKEIAQYSDVVLAFIPDGVESKGTENTIMHATKLNKKVYRIS
jgi:predicted Rossmann fold nucleotide-binding protein DprA/Smf involved in DNA uptake